MPSIRIDDPDQDGMLFFYRSCFLSINQVDIKKVINYNGTTYQYGSELSRYHNEVDRLNQFEVLIMMFRNGYVYSRTDTMVQE